jgi:hypothetical protein
MNILTYNTEFIKPILKEFDLFSDSSSKLIAMTTNHESGLYNHNRQIGLNPDGNVGGFGMGQIELATHKDIYVNYLIYKENLCEKIIKTFFDTDFSHREFIEHGLYNDKELLQHNNYYNSLICRIHYLRVSEKLPDYEDNLGMAKYWKKYYNTELGKGTVEKFLKDYDFAINLLD